MPNPTDHAKSNTPYTQKNNPVTAPKPADGSRNYLTDLSVCCDAIADLQVLSSGVVIYEMTLAAGVPFVEDWRLGLIAFADITITVSTGNYTINASVITA